MYCPKDIAESYHLTLNVHLRAKQHFDTSRRNKHSFHALERKAREAHASLIVFQKHEAANDKQFKKRINESLHHRTWRKSICSAYFCSSSEIEMSALARDLRRQSVASFGLE